MANILVAEDNAGLRRLMGIHLHRGGYTVFEAEDGVRALEIMEHEPIHLVVADVMMPRMDGWELTRELRETYADIPILIVTAKDTLEDKKQGFSLGADDYLTKPVDFEEMLLRIGALLRRFHLQQEEHLQAGGCTLEADTLFAVGEGYRVELRPKEFALLRKLLANPMKIFTRQTLMDEIWGYDSESDPRTVDTHIRRLREKFARSPDFEIQTVRGLGYRAVIK